MSIKNSIVPFIKNQFPQHIAETESLLIPFMEAYYEWMSTPSNIYDVVNDLSTLSNIDISLTKFQSQFEEEYLKFLPKTLVTDKALTIKHINDLYKAKGTPAATRLLIKLILGKDSEVFYPATQILKASDGQWIQDNSILVSVISGNIFDIVGESVKISTSQLTFSSIIEKVKLTDTVGIFEVFLERKLIYTITENSLLSYNNVLAQTNTTVASYKILNAGKGFRVGQIFNINNVSGKGTVAKVKSITSVGGILSIQIIKFGFGYDSDFILGLNPDINSTKIITEFPILTDAISGTFDSGYLSKYDYTAISYMDESYVGEILTSFQDNTKPTADNSSARIEFILGSKLKYPGYYNSVSGFLSDAIYLQDNLYYQIYSYVVRIDEILEKYQSTVENTVHPAGMRLFGEYALNNNFQLNTKLSFILNFFRLVLSEVVSLQDLASMYLTKNLIDSFVTTDSTMKILTKPLLDSIISSDASSKILTKPLLDAIISSDSTLRTFAKILTDTSTSTDSKFYSVQKFLVEILVTLDTKQLSLFTKKSDTVLSSDSSSRALIKSISDSTSNSDLINKVFTKALSDIFGLTDSQVKSISKGLADNSTPIDTKAFSLATNKSDIAISSEAISNRTTKVLSDIFGLTDSQVKSISKSLADTPVTIDTKAFSLATKKSDTAISSDIINRAFTKSLAESTSNIDIINKVFTKALSDTPVPIEAKAFSLATNKSDIAISSEAISNRTTKVLSDSTSNSDLINKVFTKALSDIFGLTDSQVKSISKGLADNSTPIDTKAFSLNKYLSDIGTTSDSGILYFNYYTDPGYAQSDYLIGASTF